MANDLIDFALNHIRENGLHGSLLKPPAGFLRGVDVLADDFEPAFRRSVGLFQKHHRHYPDLISPSGFTQKQLLFKFFAPVPIHSPSDKIGARQYLPEFYRDKVNIPKIVWKSNRPELPENDEIDPGRYWLKSNHGSGRNIPVDFPIPETERKKLIAATSNWLTKTHGKQPALWWNEVFSRQIYLEEDLSLDARSANDWKFFVANGKVVIYQYDQDRFGKHDQTIYDREGNHIKKHLYVKGSKPVSPPACLGDMIAVAEAIGQSFDFIRVDLFLREGQVYLGEIGLVPNGCTLPIKSPVIDYMLGTAWIAPWMGQTTQASFESYASKTGKHLWDRFPITPPEPGTIWNKKRISA